jgi:peptidoglycan hydrolase-like protein with peptidoglycan-binding domain
VLPYHRRYVLPMLAAIALGASAATVPIAAASTTRTVRLGDRTLRAGAKGADVKSLQKALIRAGFDVNVDGQYGTATVRAVKRFQRSARLAPSGTAGTKTIAALRSVLRGTTANTSGGFAPGTADQRRTSLGDRIPLTPGMSGHDVKVLQDFLKRAGVKDVTVDGEFAAGTTLSVKRFELKAKRTVDGIVDAGDIDALRTMAGQPDPAAGLAPLQLSPGDRATVGASGIASAPANAPDQVKQIIAAGNAIATKPYIYGGGHGRWNDKGYDCSGSVSYALHGAGLLDTAMPSGDFMDWGDAGAGMWVTLYAKGSHIYMVVAGLRFDTSGRTRKGSRWQSDMRPAAGYSVRHPPGL